MDFNENKNTPKYMDFKVANPIKRKPQRSNTFKREVVKEPDINYQNTDPYKNAYYNEYNKNSIISRYRYNLGSQSQDSLGFIVQPNFQPLQVKSIDNPITNQSTNDLSWALEEPELDNLNLDSQQEFVTQIPQESRETESSYPAEETQNVSSLNPSSYQPITQETFTNAIQNAPTKFDTPSLPKKRFFLFKHPVLTFSTLIIAGLIVAGFMIVPKGNLKNIPYILASYRAGFTPTISGYQPSGYSLSSVSSASGIIESSFMNNLNNQSYSIIEKKSNLTANQLLNNYILNVAGLNYRVINTTFGPIYIYNNGANASWVHNHIWFIIKDSGSLNNIQITQIASAM